MRKKKGEADDGGDGDGEADPGARAPAALSALHLSLL